jgi:hypothetical protein
MELRISDSLPQLPFCISEYRIFKTVEITIRRGLRKKGEK